MFRMKTMIDEYCIKYDPKKEEATAENLRAFFCSLVSRRVWLFLKFLRIMHHLEKDDASFKDLGATGVQNSNRGEMPEDRIVQGESIAVMQFLEIADV